MQEVKGYLDGERNYLNLYGDTGPLVYPAGFVYIFSALYWLTNEGADVLTGKNIILVSFFEIKRFLSLMTCFACYSLTVESRFVLAHNLH